MEMKVVRAKWKCLWEREEPFDAADCHLVENGTRRDPRTRSEGMKMMRRKDIKGRAKFAQTHTVKN